MLALALSTSALAHDAGGYSTYPEGRWAGNVVVWGNSIGQADYAGTLSYGVGYGYSPGYVPWLDHRHGPQCHHGPVHGYPQAYRHGKHKGRKHGRKHHGRHH